MIFGYPFGSGRVYPKFHFRRFVRLFLYIESGADLGFWVWFRDESRIQLQMLGHSFMFGCLGSVIASVARIGGQFVRKHRMCYSSEYISVH